MALKGARRQMQLARQICKVAKLLPCMQRCYWEISMRILLQACLALSLVLGSNYSRSADGCRYDTQCKGDRVCQSGQCVSPGDSRGEGGASDEEGGSALVSTTCKYRSGPKRGRVEFFPPNTPGLVPAMVGQPCTDGMGSVGVAIPDR